jgi:predicted dehydrogenase/threonine dehydrogenase-like Zn-dependent dehydrogenase
MKQVVRRVIDKKGMVAVEEIPTPNMGENQVLISTHYSLISSGTELATVDKNPVELAKQTLQDPWMRSAVKNLIFSGGIRQTLDTVANELTLFRIIGYSGSGVVIDKGRNVEDIKIGDRVAFAAQGHAEQVAAYANHVVRVPDTVDLKSSAFVTVGGIALQGVRRSKCTIGEWVVVYGLGLVGQLAVQILLAAGAKVIGIDLSESRIELAEKLGLKYSVNPGTEDVVNAVLRITNGKGADSTIICAFSKEPVIANNAMKMTRKQGRVVFVGLVKMDLERMPFFVNELDLSFSRAYGPGSYDSAYEKGRVDYPYHYVRWTEKRNLEEVIRLIKDDRIKIEPLIDSVFPLDEVQAAFDKIKAGDMKSVAMLLAYSQEKEVKTRVQIRETTAAAKKDVINIGVIGVGNFTRNVHIPNLSRIAGYSIRGLCSASGTNAASVAKRFKVDYVTSDYHEVLKDPQIDMVLIATRHNLHSRIAIEAAKAGKHIFVEKPVAMNMEELEAVKAAVTESGVYLMIGYNRRYSHAAQQAKKYVAQLPIMIKYTVNIQNLPDSHWTLDPLEGGGRLIGEADHFFDLMNFFSDSRPVDIQAHAFPVREDAKEGLFNFMVQVKYENNSIGQLMYTSLGGPTVPRESVELFCGSKYVQIIDFKKLLVNGKIKSRKSDMGHFEEMAWFRKVMSSDDSAERERLLNSFDASWITLKASEIINRA